MSNLKKNEQNNSKLVKKIKKKNTYKSAVKYPKLAKKSQYFRMNDELQNIFSHDVVLKMNKITNVTNIINA